AEICPARAQRVTVLGLTLNIAATSDGVKSASCSELASIAIAGSSLSCSRLLAFPARSAARSLGVLEAPLCATYPICPCPNRAMKVTCEVSGGDSPSGPNVQREGNSYSSRSVPPRSGSPHVGTSVTCGDLADDPRLVAGGPDAVQSGVPGVTR